jgi:membrane protease YdiL (CAAX protease family)
MTGPFPQPAPDEDRSPFWDWHDAALFVALAVPCLLLSVALSRGFFLLLPTPPGETIRLFTAQFLAYLLWFSALWLMLKTRYDRPFWRSLGWNVPWPGMSWCIVFGPTVAFTVAILGVVLQTPVIENPIQRMMSDRGSAVLVGFFATTLGPLAEELIFRGFFLPLAARSVGPIAAVAVTNLPFVLLHGPQYGWTWQHLILLFLASSAFGYTRLKTGSTAASTLVHAGYNATFFSALLVQGASR